MLERILLQGHDANIYVQAIKNTLPDLVEKDPLLASRLFDVPTEGYLGSRIDSVYSPIVIQEQRDALIYTLARALAPSAKRLI